MPREIPVGKSHVAVVDNGDYEWLSQWRWRVAPSKKLVYAGRTAYDKSTKKSSVMMMHRLIMDAPKHLQVDHLNYDTLDNRRDNLRLIGPSEHGHSRLTKNKTGFRGVTEWFKRGYELYTAKIKVGQRFIYLGYYHDPRDAARAYNDAALKYFGEFAVLNKL